MTPTPGGKRPARKLVDERLTLGVLRNVASVDVDDAGTDRDAHRQVRPDGPDDPLPGSDRPLATAGIFLLWLGWFGFNGGSVLSADPELTSGLPILGEGTQIDG